MRDSLKANAGWLGLLAFFALPNCSLHSGGIDAVDSNFNPGAPPRSSAIFCDIEDRARPRHCANAEEAATGVPLARAAVALVNSQSGAIGLDFSPSAIADLGCASNQPVAVTFHTRFPDGTPVCLNCAGVIGPVYASVDLACAAKCMDLSGAGSATFCGDGAHVHASTNTSGCLGNACTNEGTPRTDFVDPRRRLEPVQWRDLAGTAVGGADSNSLTRTAATSMPSAFDAGAASSQTVHRGDGWVEFTAVQTNSTRGLGFATGGPPDADPTQADIDFGIFLSSDGHVFVVEKGSPVAGPNPDLSFATYASGDRMRVTLTDKLDGSAEVKYFLIPASCAGAGCDGMLLHTSAGSATYPLRVDASLREAGAALDDVRLVRIK